MNSIKHLAAVAVLALVGANAQAAPLYAAPVASNAYITMGGLDWAWANPLPATNSSFDLAYQSGFGWRLPTAAELLNAPLATDFLFAGANVPFNGVDPVSGAHFAATQASYTGDGACAAPYFSNTYRHCDWQDGLGEILGPWAGMAGAETFAEQLVVRNAVPEPTSLALLGLGLAGFGMSRRRKS